MKLKDSPRFVASLLMLLLVSGCAKPISDAQAKYVIDRCQELGMATRVFNGLTSFAECVPVTNAGN